MHLIASLFRKYPLSLPIGLIVAAYLFFGAQHLGRFITADEHYWIYERIPAYWQAWESGEWKKTAINDKPGVSIALLSGTGLLFEPDPASLCSEDEFQISTCDSGRATATLLAFRIPILVANALLLILIAWLLARLYGRDTAIAAALLIAFSPILVGMTQIINPDALLWSFGTAALLSFLALLKLHERKFVVLSGILLGMAILSKYTASFLLPFFIFLIGTDILFQRDTSPENLRLILRRNMLFFFSILGISTLVIALFLPAIWLKPSLLADLLAGGEAGFPIFPMLLSFVAIGVIVLWQPRFMTMLSAFVKKISALSHIERSVSLLFLIAGIALIAGRIFFPEWSLFEKIPFDLKDLYSSDKLDKSYAPNLAEASLLELNPLIFSIPPIVLLLFGWHLAASLLKDRFPKLFASSLRFENFALLMFVFFFLIAILFSEVLATARYLILLYPIIAILAASAIAPLSQLLRQRNRELRAVIAIASLGSLIMALPFAFNYTNLLLPKQEIVHHSWGYGGYEAAQYLNSLPNAEHLLIWSDYYGVCEFFKGHCLSMEYEAAAQQRFDYAVLSHRGRNLYRPEHSRWLKKKNLQMSAAYADTDPDWELFIGGRPENFVKVIKIDY
ncbi:MAG: glycosyltransferase family 39 protein [Candidatus Moranbacteria bacterium]|nr:glycosyltransferase family 39 protein [Candidatus Moranbacteria bacterium]MBP6034353.1 glycosyltransferase family 39 protein [Candidatus Moranbacteria bacterium]MBP7696073.1 glycosyltransferase family 39 protein [Candidatus Moranbacteria bacterium]